MSTQTVVPAHSPGGFKKWLLKGGVEEIEGPHEQEGQHHTHPWWKVMCLTGVDYFSTLGYQPGIAFLAAGALSPIATIVLVLLTLFGALPIYGRVAAESPNGEGSISMLENLLPRWKGKLFVLALLGFVATDFVITITLSAADATAHILENPYTERFSSLDHPVVITLMLVAVLGGVFLKGFKEAIGIAVVLVIAYLLLNTVVLGRGIFEVATHPEYLPRWRDALYTSHANPFMMLLAALVVFPKLALGLSGFETGVAVMPLVKGGRADTEKNPAGRVHDTKKLLRTAALIMSVMLITSSFVTTLIIPPEAFQPATSTMPRGEANGRALAYLAHHFFGDSFGTLYDLSTILILWFAGASAMAGLLNIVPRYLPRYGMAPDWARATRPLVLVFTAIAFAVTIIFKADVDAQGGAYATGVLVLMTSAAFAVMLSARRRGARRWAAAFLLISLVFAYTTIVNVFERPEGIKIASIFIGGIVLASLVSRVLRTTELRVVELSLDAKAREFIEEASRRGDVRIVANRRDRGDVNEYMLKEREKRAGNHIPTRDAVLFFEVKPGDASEFTERLKVRGVELDGYRVLRTKSPAVPNAIAAFLLHVRNTTGKVPHVYFGWSEGNPLAYLFKYVAFGEGDTAPVTHEVLRQAEKDPKRRPVVHVGG
jgi:hypothetical protein